MREFRELIEEAERADVSGWDFAWLDGRATEERPPWGYARMLGRRLGDADRALDLDTGGGEAVDEAPVLPTRMVVTEGYPPNAARARSRLGGRGVEVVEVAEREERLPFEDASFDLVTSRHPVRPEWHEISRVLAPGGHYFAQHVGPGSAFDLIERFVGPLPDAPHERDPERERAAAEAAGLRVVDLRTARLRMVFFDVGAIIWILRKCVWWVPDFSVSRYASTLRDLDAGMRGGAPFVAHSTRHLIEAVKPNDDANRYASDAGPGGVSSSSGIG